jgi:cystathionine beta-lyase
LRDAKAAACLFSVVFDERYSQSQVDSFCDHLQLFKLGWSWAGPVSLCAPYNVRSIRTRPWPHNGCLVRFAVGLEAVDDLKADISQALSLLRAS